MRVLILSEQIDCDQSFSDHKYEAPADVELTVADLNTSHDDELRLSLFDYDVAIVHIKYPSYHTIGYYQNLPKLARDCEIALDHGRCVICLPATNNFFSKRLNKNGMQAYEWLSNIGVELQDNYGESIKPTGSGKSLAVQNYLEYAPCYFQVVVKPELPLNNRLAVVDGTEIVVGMEYQIGQGVLVVLPPPLLSENEFLESLERLIEVARRYYDRSQRRIPIGDEPEWLGKYAIQQAKELADQIAELVEVKAKYDKIAYVLYGTGDDLETSVASLLEDIGFDVQPQEKRRKC